jgi:death-on-curing family protein
MARTPPTVREIAREADRDPEEVLVTLWDDGLDYLDDLDDRVQRGDIAGARRALGVSSPQDRRRLAHWEDRLELSPNQLLEYLDTLDIKVGQNARNLPKGALKKLERAVSQDQQRARTVTKVDARRAAERQPEVPTHDEAPLIWEQVGTRREVVLLRVNDVEGIHWELVDGFRASPDPINPPGVRDPGLLESAASRPATSLGGQAKYPTPEMAAAALLHSVIHNHPFHNGNKRTALVAMLCQLDQNNIVLTCSESALFKFVLKVAQHRLVPTSISQLADREVLAIASWIHNNSRMLDRSQRPLKWRELKKILRSFDCQYEHATRGNRINLYREVEVRRGFLVKRTHRLPLKHQTHYADDGREVSRSQLHDLRKALRLDEEHGVDSSAFYGSEAEVDDFINRYRTTLRRLAKL